VNKDWELPEISARANSRGRRVASVHDDKPFRPMWPHSSAQKQQAQERLGVDVFAIWKNGGRTRTPNTVWHASRSARQTTAGLRAGSTLSSILVTPRSCSSSSYVETSAELALEGDWFSRADGEYRGRVEGGRMYWVDDDSSSQVTLRGERRNFVTMNVDGEAHSGVVSEDGRLLRWNDGDVWTRIDDISETLKDYCNKNVVEEHMNLEWGGWTSSRPASRPSSRLPVFSQFSPESYAGTQMAAGAYGFR